MCGFIEDGTKYPLSNSEMSGLILRDELAVRGKRVIKRPAEAAVCGDLTSLEPLDISLNPAMNKLRMFGANSIRSCPLSPDP